MSIEVTVPGSSSISDRTPESLINLVTPGWFTSYGTPIRLGRDVEAQDGKNAAPIILVNEAFVRTFLPSQYPIGATVILGTPESPQGLEAKTVVGVVGDAVYRSLRAGLQPTVYVPLAQAELPFPMTGISIGVRASAGEPAALAPSVAAALTRTDRDLAFNFRPLADHVSGALTRERVVARLSGFFGALGLLLAALGLFGVTSYVVSRRRLELGIRIALGARPSGVVWLVTSRMAVLVMIGVALGAVFSLWASQFVATLLFGLQPHDPATLIGAVLVLVTVATFAAGLPAWRASRIDPTTVLRAE
jgi:hypothetical protein